MQRGDRDRVEQAEAHGARRLGVVPRRAHGAEGVIGFSRHDLIHRVDGGAARAQRGFPASRRDDGIGIEPGVVLLGDGGADHLHIGLGMQALDQCEVGERRLLTLQRLERRRRERIVDGAQTIGPLGVAVARVMLEAGRMGQEERGHEQACMVTGWRRFSSL
jgi:hypothetical protein